MDIRKIRKLIELLEETGISEIEIKEGEESLRLSRHSSIPVVEHPQIHYAPLQYHKQYQFLQDLLLILLQEVHPKKVSPQHPLLLAIKFIHLW